MLRVPGEQQVMLKVRVAEIHRTDLRDLGVDYRIDKEGFLFSSLFGSAGNARALLDGRDVDLLIRNSLNHTRRFHRHQPD